MILAARDLSKSFGLFRAVDRVSLEFAPGQIHAIVGENGAGKSTFLKLMFGLLQPTEGHVEIDGQAILFRSSLDAIRAGIGMVQQHFTLVETVSVIDNIMLGAEVATRGLGFLKRRDAIKRIEKLIPDPSLRLPWNLPVSELTVGQRQRVEILKVLFRESQVLILDEPTAVLTPQEVLELFQVLRSLRAQGRTLILISHKMQEIFDLCDTFSVLRNGRLVTSGEVNQTQPEEIVQAMIGRPISRRELRRKPARSEVLLSADRVREKTAERGQLHEISLNVHAGEIVGVAGVEGSGQAHFVEALMGVRKFEGELKILGRAVKFGETAKIRGSGVGLVPEDRHHQALWMDESCHLNFIIGLEDEFVHAGLVNGEKLKSKSAVWSKAYDVRAASLEGPVRALSGGNQQKLIFAREVLGRAPKLLICHQPTRGVDLAAIDLIYSKIETLRAEGLGVLILSSELDELTNVCDRLYVFFEGRVSAELTRDQFDHLKIGRAMTVPRA